MLVKQLQDDNRRMADEVKKSRQKLDDREWELMIENEKLRLEIRDMQNSKTRFAKSIEDNESKTQRLQIDLKIAQEENKKLKINLQHTEQQKRFEVEELEKELKSLREQCNVYKAENEKFRAHLQERAKTYSSKEYPDMYRNREANLEIQKKRVQDLLNYRLPTKDENNSKNLVKGENVGSNYGNTEAEDDWHMPIETPSRSHYQPSSEEAFLRSSQRRFVKNFTHPDSKGSEEGTKTKIPSDKDRNVYSGFKENESDATWDREEDLTHYQQKLMKSIERRVGGKFW